MLIDCYCSAIHSLDTTSAFSTPTYTLSSPLTNPIPRYFLSFLLPWQSDDHDISSTTSVNASITSSLGSTCVFIKRNNALTNSYWNICCNIYAQWEILVSNLVFEYVLHFINWTILAISIVTPADHSQRDGRVRWVGEEWYIICLYAVHSN